MTEFFGFGGFGGGLFGVSDVIEFDALTKYYINLLIIQYNNKPKARATVGINAQQFVAGSISTQVLNAFDLDTAVGKQLDTLASYRGAIRTVFGLDLTRTYFAMPFATDPDPGGLGFKGFALAADAVIDWYWLLAADFHRPADSMTDDELRRLTKFLAKTQSRFLSLKEIDDILFEFFADKVTLTDNGDMTITYVHDVGDPDTLFGIVEGTNSLPKPAGVEIVVL